jgi:hypothetical protein
LLRIELELDETGAVYAATDGLNALRAGIATLRDSELFVITIAG